MSGKPGIPVVVTGFGPFGIHKVNISWEIAKILPSMNFESLGIDLHIEEIPVVYSIVSKDVPSLWKKYKPELVIHMGVTSVGSEMTLEKMAHRNGYTKVDTLGKLPEYGSANGERNVISTNLDVQDVCDQINNSTELHVPITVSVNAGRYLCEFTYYTSLNINNKKTVFVHVPDFNKGYTVAQMALVVKRIILLLLEQTTKPSVQALDLKESENDKSEFDDRTENENTINAINAI